MENNLVLEANAWLVDNSLPYKVHLVKETDINIVLKNRFTGNIRLIRKRKMFTQVFTNKADALAFAIPIQERRVTRAKTEFETQTNDLDEMKAEYEALKNERR